jgi:hypothetical protein
MKIICDSGDFSMTEAGFQAHNKEKEGASVSGMRPLFLKEDGG